MLTQLPCYKQPLSYPLHGKFNILIQDIEFYNYLFF